MKLRFLFLLSVLSITLLGCKSKNDQPIQQNSDVVKTKRNTSKIKQLKYDEYQIVKDTLLILTDDDFLDYPFGCFKQLEKLKHRLNYLDYKQEVYDEKGEIVKLERFYSGNNFIKFYYVERFIDNKTRFEIVSAKINDKDILLENGIHVGMNKEEFFSYLPKSIKFDTSKIKVVKLYWDVLGVSHYYYINDTLTSITINTDFQVDKN
jgi:hypothetical protein